MSAIPWNLVCACLSLAGAAAVATIGQPGRMPRYVAMPLAVGFIAAAGLSLLFAEQVIDAIYLVYLETWPLAVLPVLIVATGAACYFLIALWAGTSDAHWFWRWGATLASVALLAAAQMVEPVMMLLTGMFPVMLAGWWWKRWQRRTTLSGSLADDVSRRSGWRVRLQSLFLSFVLIGLAAVSLRSVVHANLYVGWLGLAAEAVAFAVLGLATASVARATWTHRLWLAPLWCIVVAYVAVWHHESMPDWAGWSRVIAVRRGSKEMLALVILGLLTFAAIVAVAVWLAWAGRRSMHGSLQRRLAQMALVSLLVVIVAPLARVYWGLLPPVSAARESVLAASRPADESSTYEQLVQKDWGLRWPMEARPSDRFGAKLSYAAEILKVPDRIWVDPDGYALRRGDVDQDLQTLLVLYYHFDRAQWIAASEGKFGECSQHARAQWQIIELLATSNVPGHQVAARSLHDLAMSTRVELQECFTTDELKRSLRDSADFIASQPSAWDRYAWYAELEKRSATWRERLAEAVRQLAIPERARRQRLPDPEEMERQDRQAGALSEGMEVRLALELYRRQHGSYPERLSQLTPEILPDTPTDPFAPNSQPPGYHRIASGIVLYSIGPDGVDDGGKFGARLDDWRKTGYDLNLQFETQTYADVFPWRKLPVASGNRQP